MAFFWIFLKDRECTSERKTKSQAIANKMITFQIIDHSHCVSYLSCRCSERHREREDRFRTRCRLVQAAASHAATHEQVNHASRGHKPRAIRGETAHENGRRARRGRRAVGEASSAHRRPLCVIGANQRAERIFAELAIILMACQGWANERSAFWTSWASRYTHMVIKDAVSAAFFGIHT